MRDIDLESNSNCNDSLLYKDSPRLDEIQDLKAMKGLEQLAKLSIEDDEFEKYKFEQTVPHKSENIPE